MLKVGDEVARTSGLYQITPCTAGCETGCKTRCRWLSRRNVLLTHIDSEAELVELRDLLNREFPVEPEPQSDAESSLTIEQVIAACEETTLRVCRETNGWRADIGNGCSTTADTPEAAIQALGNAAIAKLRERHARDAAKLKALGVIP